MEKIERIENIYEVTKRLCGFINPCGESGVDEIRLANLRDTISVTYKLFNDIIEVSKNINSYEHSVHLAGKEASDFIKIIHELIA